MLQWVATYSPRNRLVAGSPLPGAWYWRLEGGDLVLDGLEGNRASGCGGARNLCVSQLPPQVRVRRVRADQCHGDVFDEIALRLTPEDWSDAHVNLPNSVRLPDISHPRICRRVEASLAVGILRTIHAEDYDDRRAGQGPVHPY